MKVAIQGLGEVPTTVLLVLRREKPDVTHVICSDYQLKFVAKRAGFEQTNEEVIKKAAKNFRTRVVFHRCDVFDPSTVGNILWNILDKLDPQKDEVIINYTGGSAVVRLLLGTLGMMVSAIMNVKIVYAVKYRKGIEISRDHTKALSEIQRAWMAKRRELGLAPESIRQTQLEVIKKLEEHFGAIRPPPKLLEKYRGILIPKTKITYGEVVKPLKKIRKPRRRRKE
jgi:hypothetical protein